MMEVVRQGKLKTRLAKPEDEMVVFELTSGAWVCAGGICAQIIAGAGRITEEMLSLPSVNFGWEGRDDPVHVYETGDQITFGYWFVSDIKTRVEVAQS